MESRREIEVKKKNYTFKINTSYFKKYCQHKSKVWLKVLIIPQKKPHKLADIKLRICKY